jgi:hypothetical protein
VSTFDDPSNVRLGSCKLIEEIMIGEDRLLHFSGGCKISVREFATGNEVPLIV